MTLLGELILTETALAESKGLQYEIQSDLKVKIDELSELLRIVSERMKEEVLI